MFAKSIIISSFVLALAASTCAEPIPLDRRDLGSIIDSATSVAGSWYTRATSDAASWYSVGVSDASVGISEGLSDASVGISEGLSEASTWFHSGVYATVTSIGGKAETVVTSAGGAAITLATGTGAQVTSFAGSQYTVLQGAVATNSPSSNAALNLRSFGFTSSPVLTGLVTAVGGAVVGAWITL
ncbi:hypothetical protein SERLADRAFT_404911 [Serpula lacrymans var. lacrymans S7.9]|uniref:Uncharacterized protein n=1 Tax=Serpula lacrymans var. lacrymans (strain S7.9) TaxID=578457 RepID=F8NFY4_SERL9|nr:uncharacterized protein SERLADRAFT_404911 [Serpula lacrymans var. lacrymans S7.9]EGO30954.1 hypothetical protein SERLADRAFT_404911 [Serpula lacrymans var. lacrymans S7.9]